MQYRLISACWLAIFLTIPQISMGEEELLGHMTSLSGAVYIKGAKETQWKPSALNAPVHVGNTIKTMENGQATVTFVDDSLLRISPNSQIALNTIISPIEKKNAILLFFGRIWNKISQKALHRRTVEVQTPTAICGVRGTDFHMASYEDGTVVVRVNTGKVQVDNERDQGTISANEGVQISFETQTIQTQAGMQPDWEKGRSDGRNNLFSDGERYGGYVRDEIKKRRDHLKGLVERASELSKQREAYMVQAQNARNQDDQIAYESNMQQVEKVNQELKALHIQIAFYGRRLECQFGLFERYGELAKDPVVATMFRGKDFILKELDSVEMIRAEFNVMIEEGMKVSMEDMEDLMDEMRTKMDAYRNKKGKEDPFNEL
jgi:hypothetical protein